jgi:hypothetical protein
MKRQTKTEKHDDNFYVCLIAAAALPASRAAH